MKKYLTAILLLLALTAPCWAVEKTPPQDKEKSKKVKVNKATSDALKTYMQAHNLPYGWIASGKYEVELADALRQQLGASLADPEQKKKEKVK